MSIIPNYVPNHYKTVNVMLTVRGAERALEFYNRAFGAEVETVLKDKEGKIIHAEFKIADTIIMLAEEVPGVNLGPQTLGGSAITLQVYTGDVEGMFEDALDAGAQLIFPIKKQFYGDRSGKIRDPFGHEWVLSTHMEDLTAKQIQQLFNELYS